MPPQASLTKCLSDDSRDACRGGFLMRKTLHQSYGDVISEHFVGNHERTLDLRHLYMPAIIPKYVNPSFLNHREKRP